MSLLTENGFAIDRFAPELAEAFGQSEGEEGCRLIESAAQHGRARVAVRDWLFCLATMPGSILSRQLIESRNKNPQSFIKAVESGFDDDFMTDLPPPKLMPDCVEPDVLLLLDRAEARAQSAGMTLIGEAAVTLAALETADADLKEMLRHWAEEDGLNQLLSKLRRDLRPEPVTKTALLLADGSLNNDAFDTSGLRTIQRIIDDAASMSTKRLTTRHVLYSLLAGDAGLLSLALMVQGVDVRRDVHSVLVRELRRIGGPKRSEFQWTAAACFPPVIDWLERALKLACEREAGRIADRDLHRAFAEAEFRDIRRLLPPDSTFDQQAFVEHVKSGAATTTDVADDAEVEEPSIAEIESGIRSRLFGQEAAISRVIPWIKRLRFGLPRDGRPAGVFLFVGPTGTGKTQLAREIARFVYGNEDRLLFLEMGQFKTPESISMLIGAPPGYVGYGDGKLTNGLADQPECVVLFDEIEKAHTQVFDVILRFADEGLISDPAGPVRDGRRSIIVFTTNAGQKWLRNHLTEYPQATDHPDQLSSQLFTAAMQELSERGFRPEFLARVDERLTFLPLTLEVSRQIVAEVLRKESEKFLSLKRVTVRTTADVTEHLARVGLTRVFDEGARTFPRVVNELLVTPLIDRLAEDSRIGRIPVTVAVNVVRSHLVLEISP